MLLASDSASDSRSLLSFLFCVLAYFSDCGTIGCVMIFCGITGRRPALGPVVGSQGQDEIAKGHFMRGRLVK